MNFFQIFSIRDGNGTNSAVEGGSAVGKIPGWRLLFDGFRHGFLIGFMRNLRNLTPDMPIVLYISREISLAMKVRSLALLGVPKISSGVPCSSILPSAM